MASWKDSTSNRCVFRERETAARWAMAREEEMEEEREEEREKEREGEREGGRRGRRRGGFRKTERLLVS